MFTDSKCITYFYKVAGAYDNLVSILSDWVKEGKLPWTNRAALCFTECLWVSLLQHVKNYSQYRVGFGKHHVFDACGRSAYYVRPNLFKKQKWDKGVFPFVTPFNPEYRPPYLCSNEYLDGKTIDYSNEREWCVAHNFTFDLSKLSFVILSTYEDMARFPKGLKDKIGREKFILTDVYNRIEELWPIHVIGCTDD